MNETVMTYTATEVATLLDISDSTLRKWCLELEKQNYTPVRGNNNQRFFTDQDVIVLQRLKHLVQDRHITVNDSVKAVLSMVLMESRTAGVRLNQFSEEQEVGTFVNRSLDAETIRATVLSEMNRTFEELASSKLDEKLAGFQKLFPSKEQQRQDRFDQIMAERKVNKLLEEEALSLWSEKPLSERFHKVGWFRKEEDLGKRDQFVKSYVDEHFEERLREEFDL